MDLREKQTNRHKGKRKHTNNSGKAYLIIGICLAVLAVICFGIFLWQSYRQRQAQRALQELQEQNGAVTEDAADETDDDWDDAYDKDIYEATGQMVAAREIDWASLQEQNPDVYAWITVPGTEVDYPVLQDESDDSFYLMHNLDLSSGYPGCIYTEPTYNSKDFTDRNTVLYGHNMKNGSMFASLHQFEDETFFNEHRYFYIYLPDGHTLVYAIFSAQVFTNDHLLANYDMSTDDTYMDYIDMFEANTAAGNHFDADAEELLTADSRIVTLLTCIANKPDNRWLVMGVEMVSGER